MCVGDCHVLRVAAYRSYSIHLKSIRSNQRMLDAVRAAGLDLNNGFSASLKGEYLLLLNSFILYSLHAVFFSY